MNQRGIRVKITSSILTKGQKQTLKPGALDWCAQKRICPQAGGGVERDFFSLADLTEIYGKLVLARLKGNMRGVQRLETLI